MVTTSSHAFATRAIHVGSEPSLSSSSAVIPSISLSTTYHQSSVGVHSGFEYTRSSNPTRLALERCLASLEGADELLNEALDVEGYTTSENEVGVKGKWEGGPAALAFSSGSACTATVVSGLCEQGGHVVCVGDVYGGTSRYMIQVAGKLQGVQTTFVDMSYPAGGVINPNETIEEKTRQDRLEDEEILNRIEKAITPETKVIWAETPTNPTLRLVPIALIATLAKSKGIPFVIDNTFASPYYQSPLALGATIVIHSITKYINGHSDVLGGCVITARTDLLTKFRFLQNAHGAVPSPFDSWLVMRGVKTLSLRMRQHGLNALHLATWLDTVGRTTGLVRQVYYPGVKRVDETRGQRRERELAWAGMSFEAKRWMTGLGFSRDGPKGFPMSGMVSFHINSRVDDVKELQTTSKVAERFLEGLHLFALAESLGGVESLAELPLKMTHAGVAVERRIELGINGELVRLSVGVEDGEDLRRDVERSLRAAVKA